MLKVEEHTQLVKLAEGIMIQTHLKEDCIPALRSGFAGYPVNPRWSGMKFHAWKMGRQWRQSYLKGEMIVRPTDLMLVTVAEAESRSPDPAPKVKGHDDGLSKFIYLKGLFHHKHLEHLTI
jgi:hypothetical protein